MRTKEKFPEFDFAAMQGITPESTAYMTEIVNQAFMEFDKDTLMLFYQMMNDAIRKYTDIALATGGNIYCSANFKTGIGRVRGVDKEPEAQQIYAPHGYDSVVDSDKYENFSQENVNALFADKRVTQEHLKMPVIIGEWGAFPSREFTGKLIEDMNGILERYLWSSAYWQYLPGMETDGNFSALKRAYPVETDGELKAYHYDRTGRKLEVTWKGREILCYVPFNEVEFDGGDNVKAEVTRHFSDGSYVRFTSVGEEEKTAWIKETNIQSL